MVVAVVAPGAAAVAVVVAVVVALIVIVVGNGCIADRVVFCASACGRENIGTDGRSCSRRVENG